MIQPFLVWELARKDLQLFVADRRGVLLCFAVPILLASAFGAIFHRPDTIPSLELPVSVVAEDAGPFTCRIVRALCTSSRLQASACDLATARRRLASESSSIVIVLPAGFKIDLGRTRSQDSLPCVRILHQPQSQLESALVEGIVTEVVFRTAADELLAPLGRLERPFTVERSSVPAGGALAANAYSHSFCGMTLQYLLFWGVDSGLLLLRERRQGIWRRLRAAPLGCGSLLAGKALATALVALAQIAITFAFGAVVFGVTVTGSVPGFVLMVLAAAVLSAATGLLVAALGGNEGRARSVAILVILTLSLLGGLWLPAFLLPAWAQQLALALPTTWAARGLEGVTWQGMQFAAAWPCALALLGFSTAFLLVAWWRLTRPEKMALDTGGQAMRRVAAVVLGLAMLSGGAVRAQQQPSVVVPIISMEDQFEKVHDVREHRGDVVVLIYGDRKSADANKALGALLHVTFHPTAKGLPPAQARQAPVQPVPGAPAGVRNPDVLAIPVACIGQVPALVRAIIRGQIRSGSPEVPVWLDFADLMKTRFPFQPGVPNVAVLDALGRYRYSAAGAPTQAGTQHLVDVIEALRREAVAKK